MENISEADKETSGSEEVQENTDLAITTQLQHMDVAPRRETEVPLREAAQTVENTSRERLREIEESLRAIDERLTAMEERRLKELTTRETDIREAAHSAVSKKFQITADTMSELERRLLMIESSIERTLEGFLKLLGSGTQLQGRSHKETNPSPSTSSTLPSDLSQTPAPSTSINTGSPHSTLQQRDTLSNQLHIAVKERNVEVVRWLLGKGADVNSRDIQNRTPLFWVSYEGDVDIVRLLIERGADVNAKEDDARTPLFDAVSGGHENVVSLLLENGANVNAKDVMDWTPLFCAAFYGHLGVVKLLLEGGADVKMSDNEGNTAALYAASEGHSSVVKLLLKRANVNSSNNPSDNSS